MAVYRDCKFKGASIVLDGNEFHDCGFYDCDVTVTRGNYVLKRVSFVNCRFHLAGEAANIRKLLTGLSTQEHDQDQASLFERPFEPRPAEPQPVGA